MKASFTNIGVESGIPSKPAAAKGDSGGGVFEHRLVLDAREGCEESFSILIERNQDIVFRLCVRLLGCAEDAREASQDVFLRAYRSLGRFEPRARFSTWLHRVAVNVCRDRLRARGAGKRGHLLISSDHRDAAACSGCICPGPQPDVAASMREDLARLEQGLQCLPLRLREALVLTAIEGLSHEEAATALSCSRRAVEGRVYRARRELLDWWCRHSENQS